MDFVPTSLGQTSLYDYASQKEFITVRRKDLERCLRTIIERTMCRGGIITEIARDCMVMLDAESAKEG